MDNFDLRNFLAEGKLYEETEALDRESVVDMAQMVADEFTKEDVEHSAMIYTVGKVDGMGFELDTQATENTPEKDAKYGTGEGWGGNFRIKALPNGYEIRNSEKGGLVATMDMEDGFKMLSADESRAEMGLEEEKENKPSNKMKKSELKEMIKMAMLEDARTDAEQEGYKDGFEDAKDDIEATLKKMKVSEAENEMLAEGLFDKVKDKLLAAKDKIMSKVSPEAIAMFKDKVEQALGKPASELGVEDLTLANAKKVGALVKDQLSEEETLNEGVKETIGGILGVLGLATSVVGMGIGMGPWIAVAGLVMLAISWMTSLEESVNEAEEEDVEKDVDVDVEDDENIDVDIEKDIEVDDEETEADIDVKASVSGESEEVEAVQGLLTKALEMSQALGDEKLEDQIGNTITYFTRAHVSRVNEMDDMDVNVNTTEMEAEMGLEEAKDEEVKENLNESVVFPMWNKIK